MEEMKDGREGGGREREKKKREGGREGWREGRYVFRLTILKVSPMVKRKS